MDEDRPILTDGHASVERIHFSPPMLAKTASQRPGRTDGRQKPYNLYHRPADMGYMQIKVYVPKVIEIPSEYLPALAKRAAGSLGDRSHDVSATRGHLVRQAVQDGLLREFDPLIGEDGTVDLVCDPGLEIPLEFDHRTLSLAELLDALQHKQNWTDERGASEAA